MHATHSGGLELLLDGRTEDEVHMTAGSTLRDLIVHIRDHMVTERPELFSTNDTV